MYTVNGPVVTCGMSYSVVLVSGREIPVVTSSVTMVATVITEVAVGRFEFLSMKADAVVLGVGLVVVVSYFAVVVVLVVIELVVVT